MSIISTISHGINLAKNAVRDITTGGKRSSRWPTVEKHFKALNPTCAACGDTVRLNVHHCMPFHLDPSLELDVNNLITLCMGPNECHLKIAHCQNFKAFNPNVRVDAAEALANPEKRDDIIKRAKTNASF
jgi:5-methylcytosine-specific restriction endonuclease McrA